MRLSPSVFLVAGKAPLTGRCLISARGVFCYLSDLACTAWASWPSLPGRTPYFRKKAQLNAAWD
jgi:hypothetical protein